MQTIIALDNQTILDISIRYFGTADAAFEIATLNKLSITDDLVPGQKILLPEADYGEAETVAFFIANKKQPATGYIEQPEQIEDNYEFPQGEFPISL